MKKQTLLALSLSLVGPILSFPTWAIPTSNKEMTTKAQRVSPLLFVLRADKGIIKQTVNGYELTLQGIDDKVLYFSDRPVRKAGFETLSQFMDTWTKGNNSFVKNPPNAAIVHSAMKPNTQGEAQAMAVELTNPTEISTHVWTFKLKSLNGTLSKGHYDEVSVFIDDWNHAKEKWNNDKKKAKSKWDSDKKNAISKWNKKHNKN